MVEQQLPKLHVVGSSPIAAQRYIVAPIVSSSKAPAVYFWFTSLEVGRAREIVG